MFCTNCGSKLEEGSPSCTQCGTKVEAAEALKRKRGPGGSSVAEAAPELTSSSA